MTKQSKRAKLPRTARRLAVLARHEAAQLREESQAHRVLGAAARSQRLFALAALLDECARRLDRKQAKNGTTIAQKPSDAYDPPREREGASRGKQDSIS